jgi:hypothetical protein
VTHLLHCQSQQPPHGFNNGLLVGTIQGTFIIIQGIFGTIQGPSGTIQGTFGTVIQGTYGTTQGTIGTTQGTCSTIQGTFGTIQGTFGTIHGKFGIIYLGPIYPLPSTIYLGHLGKVWHHSGNTRYRFGNIRNHFVRFFFLYRDLHGIWGDEKVRVYIAARTSYSWLCRQV